MCVCVFVGVCEREGREGEGEKDTEQDSCDFMYIGKVSVIRNKVKAAGWKGCA